MSRICCATAPASSTAPRWTPVPSPSCTAACEHASHVIHSVSVSALTPLALSGDLSAHTSHLSSIFMAAIPVHSQSCPGLQARPCRSMMSITCPQHHHPSCLKPHGGLQSTHHTLHSPSTRLFVTQNITIHSATQHTSSASFSFLPTLLATSK